MSDKQERQVWRGGKPYPMAPGQLTVVEMARMGGKARAVSMDAKERSEAASNAAKARWLKSAKTRSVRKRTGKQEKARSKPKD